MTSPSHTSSLWVWERCRCRMSYRADHHSVSPQVAVHVFKVCTGSRPWNTFAMTHRKACAFSRSPDVIEINDSMTFVGQGGSLVEPAQQPCVLLAFHLQLVPEIHFLCPQLRDLSSDGLWDTLLALLEALGLFAPPSDRVSDGGMGSSDRTNARATTSTTHILVRVRERVHACMPILPRGRDVRS